MHEMAPNENNMQMRIFLGTLICIWYRTMIGTESKAKSKIMWRMLKGRVTLLLLTHLGGDFDRPRTESLKFSAAGLHEKMLAKMAAMM